MATRPSLEIIAAVARDRGIGRGNELLWRESEDLKRFRQLTMGSPIVMGRRTWDSLGRPLPGRRNLVISREPGWQAEGAERAPSLDAALTMAAGSGASRVFVIGGAQIYALAMRHADVLHLTEIEASFEGADAYFPSWPQELYVREAGEPHVAKSGETYRFVTYRRTPA